MRLAIEHTTRYHFSGPVTQGLQRLRLTPRASAGQVVLDWAITCEGASAQVEYDDHNGNQVTLIAFDPGAHEVTIRSAGTIETSDQAGVVGRLPGFLPRWHFLQPTPLTTPGARVKALVARLPQGLDTLAMLHALSELVADTVTYELGHTDAETPAEAVLAAGHGVCQDHAHVFIAASRLLGVPARYVSGYLMMDDRVDQDAGHAWAEAEVEGLGWVGFDISNRICPDARYVRVASGVDYGDAAPVTGIRTGTHDETMHVQLAVQQQRVEQ
ncbi:transglutaminase family protein [Novosphingobium percolationis]|uniref:transglutaminase family protein n=1 Tax=Novosphingobium percolationis TaxID=2871811 RepID=UPI001CD57729|nr:transglutaminase family protein [Novosphingobium percolationis]